MGLKIFVHPIEPLLDGGRGGDWECLGDSRIKIGWSINEAKSLPKYFIRSKYQSTNDISIFSAIIYEKITRLHRR